MAAKSLSIAVHVDGARPILAALRKLPKEASESLRNRSTALSKTLARKVKAAGIAEGSQAAAVATTVKAVRDRVPAITAGGSTRVTAHRVPAQHLVFASEFGARRRFGWYAARKYAHSRGRQYRRHVGRGSYWFFKTVEHNSDDVSSAWRKVADDIIDSFRAGG